MGMIIRTAFNSSGWKGQCANADRDRRLFQCQQNIVNAGYAIDKNGACQSQCWESKLCREYTWYCATGEFGDRAVGKVFFVYRDINDSLVVWGRTTVKIANGNTITMNRFSPLKSVQQVRGITYDYLRSVGVPEWRAGTFRYIDEQCEGALDYIIDNPDDFTDQTELDWDIEGKNTLSLHFRKERSSRLSRLFRAGLTNYSCCVCGFDFEKVYGQVGAGYIEAHHIVPLSSLTEETVVRVSDLAAVCSNCHRMLHRAKTLLLPDALRNILIERGAGE